MKLFKSIPTIGWFFIIIILGYAQNELWPLIDKNSGWTFWNGVYYNINHQYLVKGFTDIILQCCKAGAFSLLVARKIPEVGWFCYIMFLYSDANLILYWYNFCQSPFLFYIMWVCLVIAAYKLWPSTNYGKIIKMK